MLWKMDEDDIYGTILSEPRTRSNTSLNSKESSSTNRSHSDNYSDIQAVSATSSSTQHSSATNCTPQPSLFLNCLTWWTNEDDIRDAFEGASPRIKCVQFLENRINGKSRGMAIVEFLDVETASFAKKIIDGKKINGRVCEVSFARSAPFKSYDRAGNHGQHSHTGQHHGQTREFQAPRGSRYPPQNMSYRPSSVGARDVLKESKGDEGQQDAQPRPRYPPRFERQNRSHSPSRYHRHDPSRSPNRLEYQEPTYNRYERPPSNRPGRPESRERSRSPDRPYGRNDTSGYNTTNSNNSNNSIHYSSEQQNRPYRK